MRLGSWVVIVAFALGACASADTDGSSATKPTKEVAAGGAQLRGGGIRMDVQVGRAQPKKPVKNGAVKATPHGTVTP
ncbi:MAG: hypothetical protein ACKV2T_36525 [Kofleriaceae bacterium]